MEKDLYASACADSAYAHMIEGAKKRGGLIEDTYSKFFVEGSRKAVSTLYAPFPGFQEKVLEAGNQGCTGFAIARGMMMDDMICRAKPTQVVFLGGGYACRESTMKRKLKRAKVFCLERPDVLARKEEGIRKIVTKAAKKNSEVCFEPLENAVYLPFDGCADIIDTLVSAGFDKNEKTLVISEIYLALLDKEKATVILDRLCKGLSNESKIYFDFISGSTEQGVQGYVMFSGANKETEHIKPVDTQKFQKEYGVQKAVVRSGKYLQHTYIKNTTKVGRLVSADLAIMDITL